MLMAETMELLTSGEYCLTKKESFHQRKSILFVKLTDSAQRALSNYLRNLNSPHCKVPIIEFSNEEGRLLIPANNANNNNVDSIDHYMAQFKFDVISNDTMQGKQGRFDCVQHRRGSKQLIKYGQLTQRLRIHANEDVYETTKNRMAAIEQQQRKYCTVQLDWNSSTTKSGLNRKLKLTPKGLPAASRPSDDTNNTFSRSTPKIEPSNMVRSKSRPVNNAPPKRLNPAACIIKKPLRERILHLLAIRPHKKPELETALKRDGLSESEKSHIIDTLLPISNFRDNMFHLAKHAWNDVQEDWPFYREYERQLVKKNKQQKLTSPSSGSDSGVSVGSNHSQNNGNNHYHNVSNNQTNNSVEIYKRPGYYNGVDGFQTKRQRISRIGNKESSSPACTNQAPTSNNCATGISSTYSGCSPEVDCSSSQPTSSNGFLEEDQQPSSSSTPQPEYDSPVISIEQPLVVVADASSPTANSADPNTRRNPNERPKYMKDYVTITSPEQRSRYKADFIKIFEEYERVHREVDQVGNMFAQLGESLRLQRRGSKAYAKVENEIVIKYYALKSNRNFEDAKRRYEYLHEKLSHIKNLVNEYDDEVRKQMAM